MESLNPEFALNDIKNKCARTDTIFFPISQVCTRGVTLHLPLPCSCHNSPATLYVCIAPVSVSTSPAFVPDILHAVHVFVPYVPDSIQVVPVSVLTVLISVLVSMYLY